MTQLLTTYPDNHTTSNSSQILVIIILVLLFLFLFIGVYSAISCIVASKQHTDNKGFFVRALIKAVLVIGIALFALVNYRIFSFNKGLSKSELDNSNSKEAIIALININKIEYYDTPIANEQPYIIFVETAESGYLFRTDNNGITALSVAGIFANNITPQKISPIPFWIEIIIAIVITFFPFGRSNKKKN